MIYIMKRTQLYIDESMFRILESVGRVSRQTISELVRSALAKVYGVNPSLVDPLKSLDVSFGLLKKKTKLSPEAYARRFRTGRRLKESL